ncbi:MAG TPA: DUF2000 domain-containing protein [Mycobacteriales bacterium]|nr:DUF2000 domain-containing protein [Mycobacteriales bacterium]
MAAHYGGLDVRPDLSTRLAPVKWVVVVDEQLNRGLIANAVACLAAAVGKALPDLVGADGLDASGSRHPGLPWAGCSVLSGTAAQVGAVRTAAIGRPELFVADMVDIAQQVRVYDGYLARLADTSADDLTYCAVSVAGPRKQVDKAARGLRLLA